MQDKVKYGSFAEGVRVLTGKQSMILFQPHLTGFPFISHKYLVNLGPLVFLKIRFTSFHSHFQLVRTVGNLLSPPSQVLQVFLLVSQSPVNPGPGAEY